MMGTSMGSYDKPMLAKGGPMMKSGCQIIES